MDSTEDASLSLRLLVLLVLLLLPFPSRFLPAPFSFPSFPIHCRSPSLLPSFPSRPPLPPLPFRLTFLYILHLPIIASTGFASPRIGVGLTWSPSTLSSPVRLHPSTALADESAIFLLKSGHQPTSLKHPPTSLETTALTSQSPDPRDRRLLI